MVREFLEALRRVGPRVALMAVLAGCGGGGGSAPEGPGGVEPPPPAIVALTITGTAADGLLADARVLVTVGARTQTVTAAADGRYRAEISQASEGDWVTLQVTSAARPGVALRSLVGRLGDAVARSDATRTLDAAQWPALDVGAASTAATLIATRENGGTEPADAATLQALTPWVDLDEALTLAVAIRRGLELNVPLPDAGSGLLATLASPVRAQAWFRALRAADPDGFDTTVSRAVETLPLTVPAEAAAAAGQRVILEQHGVSPSEPVVIDYRAGGEATVQMFDGSAPARWARTADAVEITLLSPITLNTVSDPDPQTGGVYAVTDHTVGLTIRAVQGWDGVLRLTRQIDRFYESGPREGQVERRVIEASTAQLYRHLSFAAVQALSAGEFASGTRWAGFIDDGDLDAAFGGQAVFEIAAGTAVAAGTGTDFTLRVAGDRLTLAARGWYDSVYLRLRRHPVNGQQLWLRLNEQGNPGGVVSTLSVVPLTAAAPVLNDAALAGDWVWAGGFLRHFSADRSGTESFYDPGFADLPERPLAWLIVGGDLEMWRTMSPTWHRVRTWQPLQAGPAGTWVLETLRDERDGRLPEVLLRGLRLQRKL